MSGLRLVRTTSAEKLIINDRGNGSRVLWFVRQTYEEDCTDCLRLIRWHRWVMISEQAARDGRGPSGACLKRSRYGLCVVCCRDKHQISRALEHRLNSGDDVSEWLNEHKDSGVFLSGSAPRVS